ncbi:MAG: hypothetical protein M1376_12020 [Planctomycetes bacterium]|nr:hypothetical protein [Planctomycetota bacterium]
MTTEAQIQANCANAQKSTGPRTPEGKDTPRAPLRATAAQNALKHGLFAREGAIRGEDEQEFQEYQENLLNQLIPGTPLEEVLAERVVDLSWRLKRAARDQEKAFVVLYEKQTAGVASATGLCVAGVPPARVEGVPPSNRGPAALATRGQDARDTDTAAQRDAAIGWMIVADFSREAVLDRLLRYERRIESSMYRALNELRRVHDQAQKARQEVRQTLARWKEEDWEAKKTRWFRASPPPEVSTGPAGPTTNTPVPGAAVVQTNPILPIPDCAKQTQFPARPSGAGREERGAGSEMRQTNPISPAGTGPGDEMCKTNPISGGGSSRQGGYTPIFRRRR